MGIPGMTVTRSKTEKKKHPEDRTLLNISSE
jgi:hypothetical protein